MSFAFFDIHISPIQEIRYKHTNETNRFFGSRSLSLPSEHRFSSVNSKSLYANPSQPFISFHPRHLANTYIQRNPHFEISAKGPRLNPYQVRLKSLNKNKFSTSGKEHKPAWHWIISDKQSSPWHLNTSPHQASSRHLPSLYTTVTRSLINNGLYQGYVLGRGCPRLGVT